MYVISWNITIGNYRLVLVESVEIKKSVDLLSDTAEIVCPAVYNNRVLNISDTIAVSDEVVIKLGYDGNLIEEFRGYLRRIDTDDSNITMVCEDAMYLFRKSVADTELNNTTMKDVAQYCLDQLGMNGLNCDYTIDFEKFVIHKTDAYGVLKVLKDETGANIYMHNGVLHIHPAYIEKTGEVKHDFTKNIEKSNLEWRNEDDRKFEVTVEGVGLDGVKKSITMGSTGGERRTITTKLLMDEQALRTIGEQELKYLSYTGYSGSITTWLVPYVEPAYSDHIHDPEYEHKSGSYYVVSVTTKISANGGSRDIELGRKLTGAVNG